MKLIWIGAGGAFGSLARYLLDGWIQGLHRGGYPLGTLAINALGAFLIAALLPLAEARGLMDSTLRVALTVGVLGGFTTYSSFNQQALDLCRAGSWLSGAGYVGATLASCLLAGVAGGFAGRGLAGGAG